MRPGFFGVAITYVLAVLAVVFYVAAWFHMAEPAFATWLIAHGCFLLLAGIWAHVCS